MKYQIITFGCQMNKSDSEKIASILEKMNYKPALREEVADLIVVNMCSVRQSAVDRVYGLNSKFKKFKIQKPKLKTILTGCILKKDKEMFKQFFDFVLDIKTLPYWLDILKKKNNQKLSALPKKINNYLNIKPKYQKNSSAFVPISNGCNNFCSYCVVPFTRGPLICRKANEILKEVKEFLKKGVKEIWLLGQNVNDYQDKIKNWKSKNKNQKTKLINFAKLIKMINDIPGNFKFFFISPHPKNFSDELIKNLAKCQKFGKYLNLPVQSGDNEILKKMNRNYTVNDYKNLVKKIRQEIPDIKMSTDVIVGFPGETKKQFENTIKLFKEIKFDNAYIAKYSPRPETVAFKMKDNVSIKEKKRRWKILNNLLLKK